jgi:hypothetical protein
MEKEKPMVKYSMRFRLIVGGVLLGVIALVGYVRTSTVDADASAYQTAALGGWQYQYSVAPQDDGSYWVFVKYATGSPAQVRAAAAAMNASAAGIASVGTPFRATLVFARPLPVAEFDAFARATGIAPLANVVRGVDAQGDSVTAGVAPVYSTDARGRLLIGRPNPGGAPIDTAALARLEAGQHGFAAAGVISTDVVLDAATYAKVRQDTRVYAVDVLPQVLTALVQREHLLTSADKIQVHDPFLYPAMEATSLTVKP